MQPDLTGRPICPKVAPWLLNIRNGPLSGKKWSVHNATVTVPSSMFGNKQGWGELWKNIYFIKDFLSKKIFRREAPEKEGGGVSAVLCTDVCLLLFFLFEELYAMDRIHASKLVKSYHISRLLNEIKPFRDMKSETN